MIIGRQQTCLADFIWCGFGFMDEWSWFTEAIPRKWKHQKMEEPNAKSLNSH
jgi:hypothetical protein